MSDDVSPGQDPVDGLAERFEQHSEQLRTVAFRMLGSAHEADAAVEQARLRLGGSDPGPAGDLTTWLTQLVTRISIERLRERGALPRPRTDLPYEDSASFVSYPENNVLQEQMADSVSLHLLTALEGLRAKERLAFVLHDLFAMPYAEIGVLVDRTEDEAEVLAGNARRRLRPEKR